MAGEDEESRERVAAGKYKKLRLCQQDEVASNVDMLNEIFKHLDAVSLAMASCVTRKWKQATDDEGLWEAICTRHWPASTASPQSGQLKSLVVALGGFRRLYVKCLQPILSLNNGSYKDLKSSSRSKGGSSSSKLQKWSNDEVYLSLSLFSIDCYERIAPLPPLSSRMAGPLCKPCLDEQRPASASTAFTSDVRHFLDGWRSGKCRLHPAKENTNTTAQYSSRKTGIIAADANYCWGSMDLQSSPK